ncbi:MAG: hypothetical protein EOO50_03680 [Flavobacterium sp.]|uniref:hypothetical protein n=1 Tax=Flavobacterium sp. TaxID=239 RepID=UPI00120CF320|nr:hypothetical protein [Flavobacterium sp.]RZJ67935.1 MAG: hypothetical protein EOO50_03680 [Flavobacterium sp.]
MRRFLLLFFVSTLAISCAEKSETTDFKKQSGLLSEHFSSLDNSTQKFEISFDKPSLVKGEKGTIIHVVPENLETENGKPIGSEIHVELKELFTSDDFFRANAPSISNGKMLLSGGEYFIGMTSNGNVLRVKRGKTIEVEFPRISTKRMELFTADRDSLNRLNWSPANQKFKKQDGTENLLFDMNGNIVNTYDNDALADKYAPMQLDYIGWIACGAFNRTETPGDFEISFADKKLTYAETYLIFKKTNSTLQLSTYFNGKDKMKFEKIPIEQEAELVCLAVKNGKLLKFKTQVDLTTQAKIEIVFKENQKNKINKTGH